MPCSREPAQSTSGPRLTALPVLTLACLSLAALPTCAQDQADEAPVDVATPDQAVAAPAGRSGGWRLAATDSPYLQQHADNPVEWFPWGEEAFARARQLDRPIFLSIGYSSCHWCHVMEHESFEDEQTAAYLNAHYVAIKVDREQRPDVDQRYMNAVQAMTGSGGWPLSVWLTPDGQPYYGGTYFPRRARGRMPSFLSRLQDLADAWENERQQILEVTARNEPILLADRLPPTSTFEVDALLADAARQLQQALDPQLGGLTGRGPNRFPPSLVLRFLLRRAVRRGDVDLARVQVTLDAMASGGLYDQLGGGFHRYSTDPRWEVPHFEKMLYDNALLACAYAEAWAVTGQARFARVTRQTLDWLLADMRSPEGLFYAARDADSQPFDEQRRPVGEHAEEGTVYLWNPAQLRAVLGAQDGARFAHLFGVTEEGNFERGLSIPRPGRPIDALAADPGPGLPQGAAFIAWLDDARTRLLAARSRRPQAFRDEKCLTAWNGLALSAFAIAGRLLDDQGLRDEAADLGRVLRQRLSRRDEQGRLQLSHQLFEGRASGEGDLSDHAYLALGALDAYEASGEAELLAFAWELTEALLERFGDDEQGGFYMTAGGDPLLPTRGRRIEDGARPSPQSVALLVLARLAPLDDSGRMAAALEQALQRFGGLAGRAPAGLPSLLLALDAWAGPLAEVVLDGRPGDPAYEALWAEARGTFLPAALRIPLASRAADAFAALGLPAEPALLEGRRATGQATAWVCKQGVCLAPASAPEELAGQWKFVIEP